MAFLYPWKDPVSRLDTGRNCSLRAPSQFLHGARPSWSNKRAVDDPPRVSGAVQLAHRGPSSVGPGGATHARQPQCSRTPASRQVMNAAYGHGDVGPHGVHVVPLAGQATGGELLREACNCRIASGSPAHPNAPGAHTRSSCSRNVPSGGIVCQRHPAGLCHRILVGIGPGRQSLPPCARGLCAITPQPGQPASWLPDSTSTPGPLGCEPRSSDGSPQTDEGRSHRSWRSSDAAAAGRVRHCRGPFEDSRG